MELFRGGGGDSLTPKTSAQKELEHSKPHVSSSVCLLPSALRHLCVRVLVAPLHDFDSLVLISLLFIYVNVLYANSASIYSQNLNC